MTQNQHTKSAADAYQKQFWQDALKHLPHHTVIKMARAIKSDTLVRYGYRSREEELKKTSLKSYPERTIADYLAITQNAALWHGTGRYQHCDNETADVLSNIATQGGLRPVLDSYAVILGGDHMVSVSATKIRIIARSYADMHGRGAVEKNRYGSALWWVSYYYGPFYAQVFTRKTLTVARHYKKWDTATSNAQGERTWGKKVNKNAKHVWDAFGLGSDIPGNYPILLGIKNQNTTVTIPDSIADVEVRVTHVVPLADITHLEVPEEKVPETEKILAQANVTLPVFPIELGEYVASRQSIAELLHT